jgi:UDP:flavonoid glycosyltransferase YjiC (YdhE family)
VAVDCMMVAALSACERARLPTAVIVHSAPGALFGPDSIHAQAVPGPLNALRATLGLGPIERLWDNWRGMTVLCTSIRALDPMGEELPPAFDYVGPVAERVPPSGWYAPWPRDDARPLVLVSFSTMPFQDPAGSRIRRTLAGLAGRPWRVLVTTSSADVSGLAAPENAVVLRHVPHGEVLPGAAATVTHGGHGTVAASLAHGVPLVCLPVPYISDQTPLAAQLGLLGTAARKDPLSLPPTRTGRQARHPLSGPAARDRSGSGRTD